MQHERGRRQQQRDLAMAPADQTGQREDRGEGHHKAESGERRELPLAEPARQRAAQGRKRRGDMGLIRGQLKCERSERRDRIRGYAHHSPGASVCKGKRMHARGEFVFQQCVYHAVSFDLGLARETFRDNIDAIVRFSTLARSGMAFVAVRFVEDVQFDGFKAAREARFDSFLHAHRWISLRSRGATCPGRRELSKDCFASAPAVACRLLATGHRAPGANIRFVSSCGLRWTRAEA